jgi:hypothetical protein
MENQKKLIPKQIDMAFGRKKVYLLGRDKNKQKVWLEAPSWDCGWYWGFGYIERYESNRAPSLARDINSHSHWDSEIVGQMKHYDFEQKKDILDAFVHHLNENPNFIETTLTDDESWKLAELMKSFYLLKESASFFGSGSAGITDNPIREQLKNKRISKRINEVMLPAIFKEIDEILSPKKEVI